MAIDFVNEFDQWLKEFKEQVNENSDYAEKGEGWGVDFNGNFIYEIQQDGDLESPLYGFVELKDGEVLSAREISEDEVSEVDYGFIYKGPYAKWKDLVNGRVGAIDGMMSGAFDLDGDMQKVLQYSEASAEMAGGASLVDTTFPY